MNMNLVEILKNCPKGTKLYSPMIGECTLMEIREGKNFPIQVSDQMSNIWGFNSEGKYVNGLYGERMLFPSKDNHDWDSFGYEWRFKNGDIVVFASAHKKDVLKQIGIVKDYIGQYGGCSNTFNIYCGIDWDGNFQINTIMGSKEIRLATEEEKDMLFKDIAKNGYKWDSEKLELRKIENYKFNICDIVRSKNNPDNIYQILDIFEDEDSVLTYRCKVLSPIKGRLLNIQVDKMDKWGELVSEEETEYQLRPFDKVLVRDFDDESWVIEFFSEMHVINTGHNTSIQYISTGGTTWGQCVPYEGNEYLLGTTNKPK